MVREGDRFNLKRVKISFCVFAALALFAGIIQGLLLVLPSDDAAECDDSAISASAQSSRLDSARDISLQREMAKRVNDLRAVVIDGRAISRGVAASIAARPRNRIETVPYINQRETLPAGCEVVSLAIALQGMGFDADPEDIADNHLSYSGKASEVYSGSPYSDGGALPPAIVKTAESWFKENGGGLKAANATGTSIDGLLTMVDLGYPVLIWVTEGFVEPTVQNSMGDGLSWYFPEHCVVLYGADGDKLLISDPMSGLDARDRSEVEGIYKECGAMAVVFLPA